MIFKNFGSRAKNINIELMNDSFAAYEKALSEARNLSGYKKWDRYLVVTGSHFLISKILRKIPLRKLFLPFLAFLAGFFATTFLATFSPFYWFFSNFFAVAFSLLA